MKLRPDNRSIVLFDGICNLCDASANFIIDHDPEGKFAFAPLQSPTGQELLRRFGLPENLQSIALVEDGQCFTKSSAALRIARRLSGLWPMAYAFVVVPSAWRDVGYDWIARNRYRWFGTRDRCRLPTLRIAERFLDSIDPLDRPFTASDDASASTLGTAAESERLSLASEQLRILLFISVFVLCLGMFLVTTFGPDWGLQSPATREFQRRAAPAAIGLLSTMIAYEGAALWLVTRMRRRQVVPSPILRYVNTAVEITVPTLIIMLAAHYGTPANAPFHPAANLYFLIILFTTLQLRMGVATFAGALAAVQYLGITVWLLAGPVGGLSNDLTNFPHHVAKAGLLLLSGIAAGIVASQFGEVIGRVVRARADHDRVIQLFGRHVSPAVVNRLLNQTLQLDGEARDVCVMFLDIRGFSTYSEQRSPIEVMTYLNRLFVGMIDVINRNHGIVNKFLGDGFMAVFGAPVTAGDDCRNAVQASLEILRELDELCTTGDIDPTRIGIGLHAGEAVTGNLGSTSRQEYTIIGNTVNLAARIEALNKQYDSRLLLSAVVYETSQDLLPDAEDLGEVPIRGTAKPIRIFKVA